VSSAIDIDEVDKAIIRHLQEDGRMPYSRLGPAVGLSQAAVRQRVQRLIEKGAMQVVAITDPVTLGFAVQAMIGIGVEGSVRAVADALSALHEVEYVVITAGRFDLLVELVCRDMHGLFDLVNDRIRPVDGVRSTEIFTYLALAKRTYSWDSG
jgi:Lrp/AsnC family transcriptional regulator, regulator for asnA, asnC and gidA